MKYTRNDSGEVIEVHGCTKCPHMETVTKDGETFMQCRVPTWKSAGVYSPRKKKLVGKWTGAYHESCPLPSQPNEVPIYKKEVVA